MKVVVGGSGGAAFVVMVETADLRHLDHSSAIDGVDLTRLWAVHLQGAMNPPPMTIGEAISEDPLEMPLVDHHHMVQAVSADAPDQPFDVGILPRASGCNEDLLKTHPRDPRAKRVTVDSIGRLSRWGRAACGGARR